MKVANGEKLRQHVACEAKKKCIAQHRAGRFATRTQKSHSPFAQSVDALMVATLFARTTSPHVKYAFVVALTRFPPRHPQRWRFFAAPIVCGHGINGARCD